MDQTMYTNEVSADGHLQPKIDPSPCVPPNIFLFISIPTLQLRSHLQISPRHLGTIVSEKQQHLISTNLSNPNHLEPSQNHQRSIPTALSWKFQSSLDPTEPCNIPKERPTVTESDNLEIFPWHPHRRSRSHPVPQPTRRHRKVCPRHTKSALIPTNPFFDSTMPTNTIAHPPGLQIELCQSIIPAARSKKTANHTPHRQQ